MQELLVGGAEVLDEPGHALGVSRIVAEEIGGHVVEERPNELLDAGRVVQESIHAVDVGLGVSGDLGAIDRGIGPRKEVVAVVHGSEVRAHEERHEAEAHEIELLNDLWAQEAQGVGEGREAEARAKLLGDGGTAHQVALLEHEDALSGLGEVGGVGEAVVASPDHDRVVGMGIGHVRPSSSRGCRTAASSRWRGR